jgi:cytochrome c
MKRVSIAVLFSLFAGPVFADGHAPTRGDIAAGQQQFNRQCVACHLVRDPSGNVLAGRNARTGPNLYDVTGRTPGSVDGFRYSDSLKELGATGAAWNEDGFIKFVQDPSRYLKDTLGDRRARARMSYQVRNERHAYDIYAFLHSLAE